MKKSDIQVGEEYAYATGDYDYDRGTATRVRVLDLEHTREESTGYGRSATIIEILVEALDADGKPRVFAENHRSAGKPIQYICTGRRIREPWAPYAARWEEIRVQRAESAKRASAARRDRLRRLGVLAAALERKGVPLSTARVSGSEAQSLANFGHLVMGGEEAFGAQFVAPLARSLQDWVFDNKSIAVPAEILETLLGVEG